MGLYCLLESFHYFLICDTGFLLFSRPLVSNSKIFTLGLSFLICIIGLIKIPFLEGSEIKPVNPKGSQSWIFIGRTDAEAETPILWPPDAKNWLTEDPYIGKDWRREEKGMAEDEMVGWHHWLNEHEFEQTLGVNKWQGSLIYCSLWGCKELDMT